jgi:hypothetical protein
MPTGIGITARVPEIKWTAKNPDYPAEPKFIGELVTSTGESQWFVSDHEIGPDLRQVRVIGRMVDTEQGRVIQITEVFDSE